MHVPPSQLHGQICPITAVVSAVGVVSFTVAAIRSKLKPEASLFGAVAAMIFVAQMFNFPVQMGTSGHLLGGVLASAILGVPFGVLAISLVVTLQALLFSDGGLSVLGVNVLNMALIGAGLGGILRNRFGTLFAAWASVMLAALACSVELSLGTGASFAAVTGAMLSVHSLIAVGEAVLTVLLLKALAPVHVTAPKSGHYSWTLLGAAVSLALLSPFASSWPDGLQWVAEKFSLFHDKAPSFVAPFSGYAIPMIAHPFWSTAVSGMLGALTVFATGVLTVRCLNTTK